MRVSDFEGASAEERQLQVCGMREGRQVGEGDCEEGRKHARLQCVWNGQGALGYGLSVSHRGVRALPQKVRKRSWYFRAKRWRDGGMA